MSDTKRRDELWEKFKEENPPKGQAKLYYADNAEYWKAGWGACAAESRVDTCIQCGAQTCNDKAMDELLQAREEIERLKRRSKQKK